MKRFILIISAVAFPGAALGEIPKLDMTLVKAPASTCEGLRSQYDLASKQISSITYEGKEDDSAPREGNRQARIGNELAKAAIVLTLMQSAKCSMPTEAPGDHYSQAADKCMAASLELQRANINSDVTRSIAARGPFEKACDQSGWERD